MLGVIGKEDRPESAVVIFRDAADEPCRTAYADKILNGATLADLQVDDRVALAHAGKAGI